MARSIRSWELENRTNRLKLPVARKPLFVTVAPGIALGYRRNKVAGAWVVRAADGSGGSWTKAFAIADDHEEANGGAVLDYWQAQDRARTLARGDNGGGDRPATVAEALDTYEANLLSRGANISNVRRVRFHLPPALAAKTVGLLGARELRAWRDGMVKKGLKPHSADRTARGLKAALALAAADDPRIANSAAWRAGLKRLPDAEETRNVILPDEAVRKLVAAAYGIDRNLGLLVETAAVTGARPSQLARIEVSDLLDDPAAPRLLIPTSRKGRQRKTERRPVPITASLAAVLHQAVQGRPAHTPLLARRDGSPWERDAHGRPFSRAAAKAGLDPKEVTIYALRHSSIVRQLLGGVPARVVAANHDTSVAMLEKTYSRYITNHSDVLTRRALLDLGEPTTDPAPADNIVPLPRKG
jgi:integrase